MLYEASKLNTAAVTGLIADSYTLTLLVRSSDVSLWSYYASLGPECRHPGSASVSKIDIRVIDIHKYPEMAEDILYSRWRAHRENEPYRKDSMQFKVYLSSLFFSSSDLLLVGQLTPTHKGSRLAGP